MKRIYYVFANVLLIGANLVAGNFEETKKLAEQGDADAQFRVGHMHHSGYGTSHNINKAIEWYRKAAKQGQVEAQMWLGMLYENAVGVPWDEKEAARWYREAGRQGETTSQRQLACMYQEGRGVEKSLDSAFSWYTRAAQQGDAEACHALGVMYGKGDLMSGPPNYKQAVYWHKKAAEAGNSSSQCCLSRIYLSGTGVLQDDVEGYAWALIAASQGERSCLDMIEDDERWGPLRQKAQTRAREINANIEANLKKESDS